MEYLLAFIEGIVTFISPCLLPMLPVYVSYFAGGEAAGSGARRRKTIGNAVGFVLGFTVVFLLLGAAAGTFGRFVRQHETVVNLLGGAVLVLLGLQYMSVIRIGFLERTAGIRMKVGSLHFLTSVVFGIVFSVGWTPCVGAFLGSALMLAVNSQEAFKGIAMLLLFSLGLGIPFVISAVLIDGLRQAFDVLRRHYRVIRAASGLLLVAVGVLMMAGRFNTFASILTFR